MRFSTLVLRSVMRRRVRSILTVIGVAIAVGSVVALVGISYGFERSFLAIYQRQGIDLVVLRAGAAQRLTSALDERLEEKLARVPGVRSVTSGLVDMMSLPELGPVGVLVQGWQADAVMFQELKILSGRRLTSQDTDGVMLGKTLAASLGKKVGQTLTLYDTEQFRVVGIFESTTVYENGGMLMLLPVLQRIMGREGQVTGFTLSLQERASQEALDRACRAIRQLDKNLEPMPTEQYVNSTNEIRFVRAMAWLTSAVALVIGTVGVLNTMIMSVYERTREIGILRAIGWRRSRVVRMILSESIVLSVAGGVAGALAAILLTRYLSTFRAVAGVVEGHIDLGTIGQGFLIALLVGVIGAAYPAYRGALLPPTEALRHE